MAALRWLVLGDGAPAGRWRRRTAAQLRHDGGQESAHAATLMPTPPGPHGSGRLGHMSEDEAYEPHPFEWVRKQVDAIEKSGGTEGTTMRGMPVVLLTTR